MSEFDELDISLYHLIFIGNSIDRLFTAFNNIIGRVDQKDETILYGIMYSNILLNATSFLNEYHNFIDSKDLEMKAVIIEIKSAVKPALNTIKKWPDLNDFRNNVLAHNLRVRQNENKSVFERGFNSYRIPQSAFDLHILVTCIGMIKKVFESAFRMKIDAFQKHLSTTPKTSNVSLFTSEGQMLEEINRLHSEVNASIKTLKSKYT